MFDVAIVIGLAAICLVMFWPALRSRRREFRFPSDEDGDFVDGPDLQVRIDEERTYRNSRRPDHEPPLPAGVPARPLPPLPGLSAADAKDLEALRALLEERLEESERPLGRFTGDPTVSLWHDSRPSGGVVRSSYFTEGRPGSTHATEDRLVGPHLWERSRDRERCQSEARCTVGGPDAEWPAGRLDTPA